MSRVELMDVTVEIPLRGLTIGTVQDPRIVKKSLGTFAVRALDRVSFAASPGDRIGILGTNGAGKTTLLRVIAGLLPPASGKICMTGSVHSVLDIGDGLRSALTGRENAQLRYYLLGRPGGSEANFIQDVEEFAQIGDFFDLPATTYSPGMLSRLLFAMSTVKHADIFILDEWLGVADFSFQKRAADRLHQLIKRNDIFIIASHNRDILSETTNRIIVMKQGRIVREVAAEEVKSLPEL